MSTTGRSASECIEQPRVGYIDPKTLQVVPPEGDRCVDMLEPVENISSALVETVVNRMTMVMRGIPVSKAFAKSLDAFQILEEDAEAQRLISGINKDLDDNSIINAVKLSGFVVEWGSPGVVLCEPVERINPDEATIQNVKTMVERSFHFAKDVEREASGYFLDLKTSEVHPTKEDVYELIGRWRNALRLALIQCRYLGIYNPRLNEAYKVRVDDIPDDTIAAVEKRLWQIR